MRTSRLKPRRRPETGFTLIELMIAVAIVAILVVVAFPSYQDSVRKSRRSEAFSAIAAVQQAQERSRGNFPEYCPNLASAPTLSVCGLNTQPTTPNGRYSLGLSGVNSHGYTLTAAASGAQAADTRCAIVGVQVNDGSVKFGSSPTSINWAATDPDTNRCWPR